MSTTYYVTADLEISTAIFNAPPGWILAEFPADEPPIPFNPLTVFTDGRKEEVERLTDVAKIRAVQYIDHLKMQGVEPRSLQEFIVDEYPDVTYPNYFTGLDDFVDALNAYKGDNIWQDLIYGTTIDGDEIDSDLCIAGTGDIIYLKSGETILYHEHSKEWY